MSDTDLSSRIRQRREQLGLSQEELANLAAVSRQSCNSALARFKSAGLVQSGYGSIVVLDLPGLQTLAQ